MAVEVIEEMLETERAVCFFAAFSLPLLPPPRFPALDCASPPVLPLSVRSGASVLTHRHSLHPHPRVRIHLDADTGGLACSRTCPRSSCISWPPCWTTSQLCCSIFKKRVPSR